jgi:hypothetical protein
MSIRDSFSSGSAKYLLIIERINIAHPVILVIQKSSALLI